MVRRERSSGGGCFVRTLLILVLLAVVVLSFVTFWVGSPPQVAIEPGLPGIGRRTPIKVKIDDPGSVEKVKVELVQAADVTPVAERTFEPHPSWAVWRSAQPAELSVDVGRETMKGLRAGKATVRVTTERAGTWLRSPTPIVTELELPVRLAPPSLGLISTHHYVAQGGCEAVVYRVGEGAVLDGVRSGDWWFPGLPLPGGDKQQRFALFAVPYDVGDAGSVRLVAVDDVGNEAAVGFVDQFFRKPYGTDTIEVSDDFMNKVVPEILAQSPEISDQGDLLKNYLAINGDLRRKNAQTLRQLAEKSAGEFLWNQPFLPMPNAAITAAFADRRTYIYNGKDIDRQFHLGFDMASVERDTIPASNRGLVVLAGYFGIYGNAVVIDHGYGLMSLYGHLSSVDVSEGQTVERGQSLGRSGKTGLALGDHLHFTMLLQGLPVTPVEWWDPHWIQDRIARKLGPALELKQ